MDTRECIDITHYAKSPRGSRRELASHARYPLLRSRSATAFSNPTTIRYVAVAANAPSGQPSASGAWVPTRYAAATASPTEMKWKLPHRWIRLGGSPKCSLAPPKARAVAPMREGRGVSIVIPPRFGVSWEREGPQSRSLSQASASVASLPDFTAAQRAAWSLSVWSAYSFAKSAIATSKRSLLPRYAAIDTRSPERACALASAQPHRRA